MSLPLRIALISEHASPLAALGGIDSGGQNVYVAHVARALAAKGHEVDLLTRRDGAHLPAAIDVCPGVRVLHVDAGPPAPVAKEQLLPHMAEFGARALQLFRHSVPYDVVRAAMALLRATPHDVPAMRAGARQPQVEPQGIA